MSAPPANLRDVALQFLQDRRLDVSPGKAGADLIVRLPKGRTRFWLHAELSRATRVWGGSIRGAEESRTPAGARFVELSLSKGEEAVRLRVFDGDEPKDDPRIALVIDDFGFQPEDLIDQFMSLPVKFTPAILPGYPRSALALDRAQQTGRSPILHLPMQPMDYPATDPGPGAVLAGMDGARIISVLDKDLATLPGLVGVNHHMGSMASEEPEIMRHVMSRLAALGLYYIDSGTSEQSVCPAVAAQAGVRCLSADLFLDGDSKPDSASMARRLHEACELARSNGDVLMIGHARPASLAFLRVAADSLARWGFRVVAAESLLR